MKKLELSWSKADVSLKPPIPRISSQRCLYRSRDLSSSASTQRISIASAPQHPTISVRHLKSLFKAKCDDMDIPYIGFQESRFLTLSLALFKDRTFSLSDSNLKEKSASVISQILKKQNFAYIDLSRNSLGDSGSKILIHGLRNCTSIVHFNLSNNEISADGIVQILNYVSVHPSLISLDISSYEGLKRNRIGMQGAGALKKLLKTNPIIQFLALSGTGLAEGVQELSEGLLDNQSLLSLDISNNFIDGVYMEGLCKALVNSQVQKLNLSSNKIKDKGCKALAHLLSNGFQQYYPLMKLDISDNCIKSKGAIKIFQALRFNNIVEELLIHSNTLGPALPVFISSFFSDNCGLSRLNMSNCQITSRSLLNISESLSRNKRLEYLNLSKNPIESEGLKHLAPGLGKNKKLSQIDLSSCGIRDDGIELLMKSMRNNTTLAFISLKDNNLKDESGEFLLNMARFNKSLEHINLELNPLNLELILNIKSQLQSNKTHNKSQLIPKIKSEIEKIKAPLKEFEAKNSEIKKIIDKKNILERKKLCTADALAEAQKREKKLTDDLKSEYLKIKTEGLSKSVLLEELKTENIVMPIQKLQTSYEKQVTEYEHKTRVVEIEIEKSKRLCICYVDQSISEEYLKVKAQAVGKKQFYEDKQRLAQFEKDLAEGKLRSLQSELQRKKDEIFELKNKKHSMKMPAEFLASHKLAQNKAKFSPQKKKVRSHTRVLSL